MAGGVIFGAADVQHNHVITGLDLLQEGIFLDDPAAGEVGEVGYGGLFNHINGGSGLNLRLGGGSGSFLVTTTDEDQRTGGNQRQHQKHRFLHYVSPYIQPGLLPGRPAFFFEQD